MREDHRVDETDATREPTRREKRDARENVHEEEQDRELSGLEAPADEEPVRDERLHDKTARERVESEQCAEPGDRTGRAMHAEESSLAFDGRRFDLVREAHEDREVEQTDDRIQDEERAIRVRSRETE